MPITETPAQVLDCKGLQCPLPVIKTAQAIKTMEPGQVLELLATDLGVKLLVCQPSLELNDLALDELIDGVKMIGGAAFNDMAMRADAVVSF